MVVLNCIFLGGRKTNGTQIEKGTFLLWNCCKKKEIKRKNKNGKNSFLDCSFVAFFSFSSTTLTDRYLCRILIILYYTFCSSITYISLRFFSCDTNFWKRPSQVQFSSLWNKMPSTGEQWWFLKRVNHRRMSAKGSLSAPSACMSKCWWTFLKRLMLLSQWVKDGTLRLPTVTFKNSSCFRKTFTFSSIVLIPFLSVIKWARGNSVPSMG